jgi:hypothetical protein
MKSLKQPLPAFPAILTVVTAVALLWLWSARAEVWPRLDRSNEGSSAPEQILPLPHEPSAETAASTDETANAPAPALSPSASSNQSALLDGPRQFALGMIETGNNDSAIGGLGEVSRFQIMPSVWKHYSDSRNYQNAGTSTEVARQHWTALYEYFKKKTEREPTDFDMYVLWNTRYGYYATKGFTPEQLHPVIRDRAQRFTNLVEEGVRREAALKHDSSNG